MEGQINFEQFLLMKNKGYARQCRHCQYDYCYMNKKELGDGIQCPCDKFEEKLFCDGCRHEKDGIKTGYCFKDGICKRYCFNPDVMTTDNIDKYDART